MDMVQTMIVTIDMIMSVSLDATVETDTIALKALVKLY